MTRIDIPTLRTDRLVLRSFRADDLDAYAAMQANPEVMRYLGTGQPRSRSESWDAMARVIGQWGLRGYGQFALEDVASGRLVGRAGILHPLDWEGPELAYGLDQPFWGQGFATEACTALHRWAFSVLGLPSLVSYILPANTRSRRVLVKLGATRGPDALLFGTITAECWHHQPGA